jgi:hypothetical protein
MRATAPASALERELARLQERPDDATLVARLATHGLALLPALEPFLASDLPIARLETYEALYKAVLRRALAGPVSGDTARELAASQLRVGPLLKYKSYAVKASSPLGYSIFLQNPSEGFSFQRHVAHKTEVFHILDAHPGGFVFLCTFEEWRQAYDPGRFADWLAGARDPAYERFRFPARPGDVFVLDELNIVHTVVGCVLEEFATISTDMVDRLHDQNAGRPIPACFDRDFVRRGLAAVRHPPASRVVAGAAGAPTVRELTPRPIAGGCRTLLAEGAMIASQLTVDAGAGTAPALDRRRATSLYVRAGHGRLLLGTARELARPTPPALPLAAQGLLTVPHGIGWSLVNEGRGPLEVALHRIDPEIALV